MKLTVFHATDGDCLLLSSGGKNVLIDGGRTASFDDFTKPALAAIRDADEQLDVIYVSHIDDDHITGVLRLIEDAVESKVAEYIAKKTKTPLNKKLFQPPPIGEVWHNGLFVLAGDQLAPQVQPVLATTAMVLAGSSNDEIRDLASQLSDIATGERASMELSRRLSPEQLDITVNRNFKGGLMVRGNGSVQKREVLPVGTMKFHLLGPSDDDIERLRASWTEWLKSNKSALKKLQSTMLDDEQRIGTLAPSFVANPIETGLGDGLKTITEANLASLMFLVEEEKKVGNKKVKKTILLTGDGVSSEIIEGLKHHGRLEGTAEQPSVHVNVLKVQHHGAEGNVTKEFVNTVTADHYVFCGNGAHSNPEVSVVEGFARARILRKNTTPFKFWFTSSSKTPDTTSKKRRKQHMQKLEALVASLQKEPTLKGRFEAVFIKDGSFEIEL